MDSAAVSSNPRRRDQPGGGNLPRHQAVNLVVQERLRQEAERAAEQVAQLKAYQPYLIYLVTSVEAGIATRTRGVPCLVPTLRNERLTKDFKGPRKVPNYTADIQPGAWIESYEVAMELLEVSDASMAKYFTMMLDGTARTWLKGLPLIQLVHGRR